MRFSLLVVAAMASITPTLASPNLHSARDTDSDIQCVKDCFDKSGDSDNNCDLNKLDDGDVKDAFNVLKDCSCKNIDKDSDLDSCMDDCGTIFKTAFGMLQDQCDDDDDSDKDSSSKDDDDEDDAGVAQRASMALVAGGVAAALLL